MKIEILTGNNIEVLRGFADNSIDSVVTDPPYGLGKEPDALAMLTVALIRYLVRLVTPPGGTCLDPFCGSGTTGGIL